MLGPAPPGYVDTTRLDEAFFTRQTTTVARDLLGRLVVSPPGSWAGEEGPPDRPRVARIVETEAYLGPKDPGSHATRGRHTQAGALWDRPGLAYVYICYGIHDMLNVVAHEPGAVGAVLIRAAEPVQGFQDPAADLLAGPGKLAKALGVTRQAHDGVDLTDQGLHLGAGEPVAPEAIAVTGRIGLSEGGDRLLRFVDGSSPALSRPVGLDA